MMKKYNTLYYFLFVVLILGAFASMAQYSYGLIICGIACLGFTGAFLVEAFREAQRSGLPARRRLNVISLLIFAAIAFIYLLRNFSFDFPLSGVIMTCLLTILLVTTLLHAVVYIRKAAQLGWQTVLPLSLYNIVSIVFILFLLLGPIFPPYENTFAMTGVAFFGVFVVLVVFLRMSGTDADDEESSGPWNYLRQLPGKSVLLMATGLLLGVLNLLISNRIFPPLYRGTTPDGYEHLVSEGAVESGALKAQEFKDQYEKFIERQGNR